MSARLSFQFHDQHFEACASGALYWPRENALIVADLHLGKSERVARRGGTLLPPFDSHATLERLAGVQRATGAGEIIALGDSFDDDQARAGLDALLAPLVRDVRVTWVSGNHDPGLGDVTELVRHSVALRHIAAQGPDISGHYHPKLRLAGQRMPAFLIGAHHLILPAFGTYTGGLDWQDEALRRLVPEGRAILTGARPVMVPLPLPARAAGLRWFRG